MTQPVVILCGGRGTRLREHAEALPKPLVEVGGRPILWHVMQLYLVQGLGHFILCTGYKGELIERFVADCDWPASVTVDCVDTGLETPTGGRIKLVQDRLGEGTFCATYADGVADIDLAELLDFHARSEATATMTVVQPELPFGVADLDGDGVVRGFREKPRSDHWVNGGFFCFEPGIFEHLTVDSVLEREPLERLAVAGRLQAYRHTGFWDCMDTYKDTIELNDRWARGEAPWKLWR